MAETPAPAPVALSVSPTWYGRLVSTVARALSFGSITVPTIEPPKAAPPVGVGFASGVPQSPTYDPAHALSAFKAHPWVYAALTAKSRDLSALPLKAYKVNNEGERGEEVASHPLLALLAKPSRFSTGRRLRQQVLLDLATGGNAYLFVTFFAGVPKEITRWPPDRVQIIEDAQGRPARYQLGDTWGGPAYAPLSDPEAMRGGTGGGIVHIRGPSWDTGPTGSFGSGAMEPLNATIAADLATTRRQALSAERGRPDAIIRPAAGAVVNPAQTMAASREVNKVFTARDGGVAALDGSWEVEVLGWSPRDMEAGKTTTSAREAVMAALSVPPTVLGLATANYATAREQSKTYWQGLQGDGALIEDGWAEIGALCRPPVAIGHDYSAVGALQEDRSLQLQRVTAHIANGLDPAAAYALEGYPGAAGMVFAAPPAVAAPAAAQEPTAARTPSPDMATMLDDVQAAIDALDGDPDRADIDAAIASLQSLADSLAAEAA